MGGGTVRAAAYLALALLLVAASCQATFGAEPAQTTPAAAAE